MRLAIVLSHPVQYYSPLFKELHSRNKIKIKVFYTWEIGSEKFDRGFGRDIKWDVPLLDGYEYKFVDNGGNKQKGFFDVKNKLLNKEIKNWNADAILVFGWNYLSHLRALIYFKGKIPVLFRGDSNLLDELPGLKKIVRRLFLKWVYSFIDIALYVGESNKKYYKKHGLKEKQLVFAPHAIDNARFMDNETNRYEGLAIKTRLELGYLESDLICLFAAKLENKKSPEILIKSIIDINIENFFLLVIGNGPLESKLKAQYGGHPRIKFLDFQNQTLMPIIYRIGDIYCLPSSGPGETWGLSVNESMASGRPVIVSNKVGCNSNLVHNGINGWVFESGNLNSLKQRLLSFYNMDMDSKTLLGKTSVEIIKNWNYNKICETIEQTLELI